MNPVARLLLGRGQVPEDLRGSLTREGVLVQEEGLRATITYRDYRSPAGYRGWQRRWVRASLVITRTRFAVYVRGRPLVNVPFGDVRIGRLQLLASETLLIGIDPQDYDARISGRVEVRLHCAEPAAVVKYVEAQRRSHGT